MKLGKWLKKVGKKEVVVRLKLTPKAPRSEEVNSDGFESVSYKLVLMICLPVRTCNYQWMREKNCKQSRSKQI